MSIAADAVAVSAPLAALPADKAQVVFLDPSNAIANAFPPAVYDVTVSPPVFIAKLGAHVNASTLVAPGHHLFMVRTLAVTQFLDATVEAGHRYGVLVRFVYGRGFQLRPLHPAAGASAGAAASEYSTANPQFKAWVNDAAWPAQTSEMLPGTDAATFRAKLGEHQAAGLSEWSLKSAEQKDELTLKPADAVDDLMPLPPGVASRAAALLPTAPALAGVPAAPASTVAVAEARAGNVRHLDATLLDGRTWAFPHARDPARFGQVELRFLGDRVHASNSLSHTEGRYVVKDDQVCADFESPGWGHICYYVRDIPSTSGGPPTAMVVNAASGAMAPLAIR